MKKINRLFVVLFPLLCFSCSAHKESILRLSCENSEYPLLALNVNAEKSEITNPQKSPYLYYKFPEDLSIKDETALQIQVSAFSKSELDGNETFYFGFLYKEDFKNKNKLNTTISPTNFVSGLYSETCILSLAVPKDKIPEGFFVYSSVPVTIETVAFVDVKTGWLLVDKPWFGFSEKGGAIKTVLASLDLPRGAFKLSVHLDEAEKTSKRYSTLVANNDVITIRHAPGQNVVTLYPSILRSAEDSALFIKRDGEEGCICGLVCEKILSVDTGVPLIPIATDPGMIENWPQNSWRRRDFELFSWEQFPYVLFFDTADYEIQDKLFKRLAFYTEKSGYRGTLPADSVIENQHGYNAHDYRAESLAGFFELARQQNFPLNEYENLLREILIGHGIIVKNSDGSITAGQGALVSISRESTSYLRNKFIVHEGFHCLYFTDEDFREKVREVYELTDKQSLDFLLRYFTVTSDLNYDLRDTYLVQNEFMAYILQQPVYEVAEYFTKILATRKTINRTDPEKVEYILETNGEGFITPAKKLDEYVNGRWGYNAGRLSLVSRRSIK